MEPVNIRLPKIKIQKIDEIATRNGITRSEVIRHALTIYFQLLENIGGFIDLRSLKISPNEISTSKWADLVIMKLKNGQAFVLANTSSGGIGPKKKDVVKLDGKLLGQLMARTALIKVLSSGALPIALVANLSVECFPTGSKIFQGIREEAHKIKALEILEGHTEENIETNQTGMGITALGTCMEKELKIGKSLKNDLIVALGEPKVGYEVLKAGTRSIVLVEDVLKLSKKGFVHEIIPVGHGGVKRSLEMMQNISGYKYEIEKEMDIDIEKSAGPSTVVLLTVEEENMEMLKKSVKKPVQVLGRIL
ncbi:MAG: ribbon-helix-helix domain-containing protein [Methanophagales archaeon]|nr:ribbon-helix-helix domain-containing protein [Methanophagales archaeon]MCW3142167.1 ribbon-helix-helix domain-containing protein [Methanophagales archaeon]